MDQQKKKHHEMMSSYYCQMITQTENKNKMKNDCYIYIIINFCDEFMIVLQINELMNE